MGMRKRMDIGMRMGLRIYRRENGAYTLCSVNNRMYWVHWEWDWQEENWNISYEYVCTHEFWKLGGYRLAEDSWCIPGSD